MLAHLFDLPEDKIRVIAPPDVGGGFGPKAVYDDDGQPLATSYLDYVIPSACEVPPMEVVHLVTPSPLNPLGVKGAGEAGTIGAPAAIAAAIEDALRPFGVRVTQLPLNPSRIVEMIHRRRMPELFEEVRTWLRRT